jgi:hypothetical protein
MATSTDWATRVKDWQASGKKAPEFCVGRPYNAKSLVWWSSHFRRKAAAAPAPNKKGMSWARVVRAAPQAAGDTPSPTVPTDSGSNGRTAARPIVVQIGKARIELSADGDRSALAAIFEALVGACEKVPS